MNIILFGEKEDWEPAITLLMEHRPDVAIVGLCDPFDSELAKTNDAVFALEELREAYGRHEFDAVITADASRWTWNDYLFEQGIKNNYAISTKYYHRKEIDPWEREEIFLPYGKIPAELHNLEFQLADHCNLNCKGCTHFSNLVREPYFADLDQFGRDMERLSVLFDNIRYLFLMGGEPLLNPDVDKFLHTARRSFLHTELKLVTNGLLIPVMSEKVVDAIRDTETVLSVSNYTCLDEQKLVCCLSEYGITKFELRNGKQIFCKSLNSAGDSDKQRIFESCGRRNCYYLDQGQVAACVQPFMIKYFNSYFGQDFSDVGGISLYEDGLTGKELLHRLAEPMEACRYCTYEESFEWEASKGQVSMQDWCVK